MIIDNDQVTLDSKIIIDAEKKAYKRSMVFLMAGIVLSFAFAIGVENKTMLFYALEGIYNARVPDTVLILSGFMIVIAMIILYELHGHYFDQAVIYRRKIRIRTYLPYLLILLTILGHISMKPLHTWYLGLQKGFDSVIYQNRMNGVYGYLGHEAGYSFNPVFICFLKNYGEETVQFSITY